MQQTQPTLPTVSSCFHRLCLFVTALNKSSLSLAINITGPCTTLKYNQFSSTALQTLECAMFFGMKIKTKIKPLKQHPKAKIRSKTTQQFVASHSAEYISIFSHAS